MALVDDAGQQEASEVAAPATQTGARGGALVEWIDHPNIAEDLDETERNAIGQRVCKEYQIDKTSRSDWEKTNQEAMNLAMQIAKEKSFPWPKASSVIFPLMTVAAIQFASRAYPSLVQDRNVVKGVVIGADRGVPVMADDGTPAVQQTPDGNVVPLWRIQPGEKRSRADRIGGHMSWQLLEEMPEWEEDTDKLVHILPIAGCVFRKSYFDPGIGRNCSDLVLPMNLVINYWAKSMERAARISECLQFYPVEIEEHKRAGTFINQDYRASEGASEDEDHPLDFIEQHRLLDLDKDGYPEPYCVTVHEASQKVARIRARYDEEGVVVDTGTGAIRRIEPVHYYTKYDFLPNPDGGIYGIGFGKLLSPLNSAINTAINQMIDAGTLANTGGGFIGRGLSMHGGSVKFAPGEYKYVNTPGSAVRDAIVPLQFPGPSQVLFSLLGLLIDASKEIASIKDVLQGQTQAADMSPTTLMGLIEQGMKVYTAIHKRVHRAAKREYDKLYRLNRVYMEDQAEYETGGEWQTVRREDYEKGAGVAPAADPNMVADTLRMARAEFLMNFKDDPRVVGKEAIRRGFEAAHVEDIEDLIVPDSAANPALQAEMARMDAELAQTYAEIDSEQTSQIKDLAQAVKALADADKASADEDIAWATQEMKRLRGEIEGRRNGGKQAGGGGGRV